MTAEVLVLPLLERSDSDLSDRALIAACAVREPRALSALFTRHNAAVYRFLSRMVGAHNPELDDLVQTTFLEAWIHSKSYGSKASVKAWLLGIAANLARHHHRSVFRRRNALTLLAHTPAGAPTAPDETASQKQLIERLRVAVEKLPHDLRVAFVMCDLEDIPGVEAARALGVRPGTMWRRLHHARRRLRDEMGGNP